MKNKTRKIFTLFLAGCMTAAMLTACGSDSGSSSASTDTAASVSESSDAPASDLSAASETTESAASETASSEVNTESEPAEQAEAPAKTETADLSDDPFSLQASVNGKLITLPCKVDDFEGTGFSFLEEELDQELEDGYLTTLFAYPESGSGELVVAFRNKSGETKKLRDITILDVNYYPCETIDIAFPGGITFSSTKDDVLNLWNGTEPVLEDESTLMYENKENYDGIDYYFDEEGTLSEVSLRDNKE